MLGFVPHPNLHIASHQEPRLTWLLAMPLLETACLLARGVAHKKIVFFCSVQYYCTLHFFVLRDEQSQFKHRQFRPRAKSHGK